MSRPPELPDAGEESAFADFLASLRPYPPPPGFGSSLLFAAGGSLLMFIAAVALGLLPSSVEGDGFHAVFASQLGSLLEVFRVLRGPFIVGGLVGLAATGIVGLRRRLGPLTELVLIALPAIGLATLLWAVAGWLVFIAVSGINLALWTLTVGLAAAAIVSLLRGEVAVAVVAAVATMALASWLQSASDSAPESGVPAPGISRAVEPQQPQAAPAPPRASPHTADRQRRDAPRRALAPRRLELEGRMDAEYARWREVPFAPPCGQMRGTELGSLQEELGEMARALRSAEQAGRTGTFRKAAGDLDRVTAERRRALADPTGFYERFGRCPSGPGAMALLW